jgi:hypothetical protein
MSEYGIQLDDRVIVGPGWTSVADVMQASHGYGRQAEGLLVVRDNDGEWEPA